MNHSSTPVSPFSLRFTDAAIERAYRAERDARRSVRQTIISYGVVTVLWCLLALWSRVALPGQSDTICGVVLGVVVPLLLVCAALGVPRATRRVVVRLEPWVDLFVGLSVVALQALLPGEFDDYSCQGLIIYCMSVHSIMGLRFLVATGVSLTIIGAYLVVIGLVAPLPAGAVLTGSLWLAAAQLIGMRVSYIEERSRKRDFFRNRLLDAERHKSETLLLNILPEPVARRLKDNPATIADGVEAVTVLFADIVGFTTLSAELAPAEVVAALNDVFSAFDEIADRFGLEKIKTIGDAYMAAGGLPVPREDHAQAVAEMALAMLRVVGSIQGLGALALRIGIHTGPVVAGVIGKKKYSYDMWGDTVNIASRMESQGQAGSIQVTEAVHAILADEYVLEPRGTIDVKGKGAMSTWWLIGPRPGVRRTGG